MAQLEQVNPTVANVRFKILEEVGFLVGFDFLNGSPDCKDRRLEAAQALPVRIRYHHLKREPISAPDRYLTDLVRDIANFGDLQNDDLTRTWLGVNIVVYSHLLMHIPPHLDGWQPEDQQLVVDKLHQLRDPEADIRTLILPKPQPKLVETQATTPPILVPANPLRLHLGLGGVPA